jgi:hypothetical protein
MRPLNLLSTGSNADTSERDNQSLHQFIVEGPIGMPTTYEFPAKVYSRRLPAVAELPSYLNIVLFGEKINKTPPASIFEYDTV